MKQSGITRRIDELGRIVIPKEIRKSMHIKRGELLEIYMHDEESLMIKKHLLMSKKDEFINVFLSRLSTILNANIYITNLSEIVFSSISDFIGQKVDVEFDKVINNANMNNIKLDEIKLSNKITLKHPFKLYPILPNGDLIGIFIIDQNKNIELNDDIMRLSVSVIENFFENN